MLKIYGTSEWNTLLKRLRDSDPSLTRLDLRRNQIEDSGSKDLSLALKENQNLTQLDLSINQIGDSGSKDLSLALKDNRTLNQLNLEGNMILESTEIQEQIKKILTQNKKRIIVQRRDQFIQALVILARDSANSHSKSLWKRLPQDLLLPILSFIHFRSGESIGKSPKQIDDCATFIFKHIAQLNESLAEAVNTQQDFKIIEKTINGNPHFRFFPSKSQSALPIEEALEPLDKKHTIF